MEEKEEERKKKESRFFLRALLKKVKTLKSSKRKSYFLSSFLLFSPKLSSGRLPFNLKREVLVHFCRKGGRGPGVLGVSTKRHQGDLGAARANIVEDMELLGVVPLGL